MLDKRYQADLKSLLAGLECRVCIPEEWRETYFQERGPEATKWNDRRRYPRHKFRTKSVLELRTTLAAIPRDQAFFAVYTRDFSRNSLSFLHVEQLFPCERVHLWLPNRRRGFRVSSCRRYNENCYLIGAVAKS